MSHMVKGKKTLTVENKDILVAALQEAYKGCTIEYNAQANIRGRPMCDIVCRRNGRNDIGFRAREDGTYDCMYYEPGYGNDVNKVLHDVYEPYVKGVARDMMKKNPTLQNYVMQETKEVERKGKKMKRIRIQAGVGSGSSGGSKTSGGWI